AAMFSRLLPCVFAVLGAACTSSVPEPKPLAVAKTTGGPDLVASGSCSHVEDALKLAVAVANVGSGRAAPSATRVEFRSDAVSTLARATHAIAPRGVASFEIDFPADCSRTECTWQVTADSDNQVEETNEANNTYAGRC
ncbi:MAG TPA: CARDB domain-containing protein, partial [Burkholderiales bacterium]|nr:CARDB domain-containing protein [Burkholderiales bacterium]